MFTFKRANDKEQFIISFCNQTSSPNFSLCGLNINNLKGMWFDLTEFSLNTKNLFSGVCGIIIVNEFLIFAMQSQNPHIIIMEIKTNTIHKIIPLKKCKDVHSLVYHENHIFIVSTGTNEIYRIYFNEMEHGNEELYWHYPGTSNNKDDVHLNGLTIDNKNFIASCFGPRAADGSFTKDKGSIFYLNGPVLKSGLAQPHSPIVSNKKLIFAESWAKKVYIYLKNNNNYWEEQNCIKLDGYTRGLTFNNENLYVALSVSRHISRSQNIQIDDLLKSSEAKLVHIDLKHGTIQKEFDLIPYGREIYDIIFLPNIIELSDCNIMFSQRIRGIESNLEKHSLARVHLNRKCTELIEHNTSLQKQVNDFKITLENNILKKAQLIIVKIFTSCSIFLKRCKRFALRKSFPKLLKSIDDKSERI